MSLNSKEISIIMIGLFTTILVSSLPFLNKINFYDIKIIYLFLIIEFIIIVLILGIIQKRINENFDETENQKKEQKRLDEKLKIHE